jgi:hypothetical protein
MSPFTHAVIKYGLVALFFAALAVGAWANTRMMRRQFQSGYRRYDPRSMLAYFSGVEFPILIAAVLIGVAIVRCLEMLK